MKANLCEETAAQQSSNKSLKHWHILSILSLNVFVCKSVTNLAAFWHSGGGARDNTQQSAGLLLFTLCSSSFPLHEQLYYQRLSLQTHRVELWAVKGINWRTEISGAVTFYLALIILHTHHTHHTRTHTALCTQDMHSFGDAARLFSLCS